MRTFKSVLVWSYWTICFHLCLLIITLLFIITYPFDRFHRVPNWGLHLLALLILKPMPSWIIDMRGADLQKVAEPTILVANHQSFLDLPLLNLLPWRMKWVTKRSMLNVPVLGWMIRMTGHIPIDRHSLRSFSAMNALVEPIQRGIPGMIFPEGTRTRDGRLQPFKRGAFMIAKKYNFKILPVVLSGGFEAMPSGTWKFNFPNKFVISVLDPVNPADFDTINKLKNYTHDRIRQELDATDANEQR